MTSLLSRTSTRLMYPRIPSTCSRLRQNHTCVRYTSIEMRSHSAPYLRSPTRHLLSFRLRSTVYPRNYLNYPTVSTL